MHLRTGTKSFGIWWICFGAIAIFVLKTFTFETSVASRLITGDTDNLMRLAEVRDWLAGQSWFDTHQYRVLPPDGISMHWSRYIDAGIAGIYIVSSWFVDPASAELLAVALWPAFLACLMVLILGHCTYRLFGRAAAAGALLAFLSLGRLVGEFIPTRIDHHNFQMLCATAVFYLSVIPGRSRLLGALAGAITALNLAIGLEMLPALATIWGLMALRYAFARPSSGDWLLGYGLSLAVAAPLLMAGQTPMSAWATNYCDVLAPPVLALAAIGIVATLVPVLAQRVLKGPLSRIAAMIALGGLGLWLAAPLLLPCSGGPYSAVEPEIRRHIEERILEARSFVILLHDDARLLFGVLLPPVVVSLFALGATRKLWGRLEAPQRTALVQAFIVILVGIGFAMLQIRAANLIVPALPLVTGFLIYAFTVIPRYHRLRAPAALVLILAMPATVQILIFSVMAKSPTITVDSIPAEIAAVRGVPKSFAVCRSPLAMDEVDSLPKSLIFTNMGLGPAIVAYTQHSVTSAPYHRSPDAYWNGSIAFESQDNLRKGLTKSGADFLVICAGSSIDWTLTFLQPGNLPDWLIDVTDTRTLVRVFQVDKDALALAGNTP